MVLAGKIPTKEEAEQFKTTFKELFMQGGEKRFLEIIKDEFAKLPMDVEFDIKNKQKNMAETVSKLNAVFRTLFVPGAIQAIQSNKGMSDLLSQILEMSGFSPVNFGEITGQVVQSQPAQPQTQPQLPVTA